MKFTEQLKTAWQNRLTTADLANSVADAWSKRLTTADLATATAEAWKNQLPLIPPKK